jgi:IPTL-CTERM motif
MKLHSQSIALVLLFSPLYWSFSAQSQTTNPARAGFKELPEARITGLPITLGVVFYTLCIEPEPPFRQLSILELKKSPGLVTVRVTGYCNPLFPLEQPNQLFNLGDLAPGVYALRYEFYNFDGSFVSEGTLPGSDAQNQSITPFTVLAPTQENLDRVFRVPTLSQISLAALGMLVGILGLRYFRKRAR